MAQQPMITVLGAGRWGTAVASLLADNGHQVMLWCHEVEVAFSINRDHINRLYCPEFYLSKNIKATANLQEAVQHAAWIFEAVPVLFLRSIIKQTVSFVSSDATWVVLSKGIEADTLMVPTQIIMDMLGQQVQTAVVVGPTFSQELMNKEFSAATVASVVPAVAGRLVQMLKNNYFLPKLSHDPIGAQLCSAFKNIIALMVGLAQGSDFKDNTIAYLLTAALEEMVILVEAMGGKRDTVYGLAGLGDMILTCTGSLSKNLKAGRLLAQGYSIDDLSLEFGTLPEGLNTIQSLHQLLARHALELPLCKATYAIIYNGASVNSFLY